MQLTQGLHRSLQATPDRIATVFGARVRTFGEQADRVARLAGGFHALGVGVGDRVGILALNSDRYAECLLAVPWAGGVVNPVNIRWNAREIAYAINDSGTCWLLVDDAFVPTAEVQPASNVRSCAWPLNKTPLDLAPAEAALARAEGEIEKSSGKGPGTTHAAANQLLCTPAVFHVH